MHEFIRWNLGILTMVGLCAPFTLHAQGTEESQSDTAQTEEEEPAVEDEEEPSSRDTPPDAAEEEPPEADPAKEEGDEEEEEVYMMPTIGAGSEAEVTPSPKPEVAPPESPPKPDSEDALETPDVVITGTRIEREVEDAPVRTQVVDREKLQQRKARNLTEALQYTSGVRVETNCQNCGFTQLRLNGLNGAYTQVLIDGLPSFSGLASVYGLEQLPAEMIQRVEIVKGGGSSLYGASAVAGVVNVITRQPRENFMSAVTSFDLVGLSTPDLRVSVDGAVVSQNGRLSAHIFTTHRRRGELDLNDDGFSELTRLRQFAGGVNLFAQVVDGGLLRLTFHTVQEYRRGGDALDLPAHEVGVAEELQTERLQGEARWEHRLGQTLSYGLGYVLAYTDRRSYYGGGGDVEPMIPGEGEPLDEDFREDFEAERVALGGYGRTTNPLHIGDARINLSYDALGPQVVTLGAQVNVDDIEDRYLGYDRVIDVTYTNVGVYLQHDWIFADWGESVLGVRVDRHSELTAPVTSPRAALIIKPKDWLRLRTAFSTGFRAPQAFDEDLHIETVGGAARLIENAPDLSPERSMGLTQQVATKFELSGGQELSVGLNGYANRLQDAFVINERDDPNTPEEEAVRENRGTTLVIGSEVEAELEMRYVALRAGWTLENAENDTPDEDFGKNRIYRTPRNYGYFDALVKVKGLQLQTGVDITGPMLVPHYDAEGDPLALETSPWFFAWNANVGFASFALDSVVLEPFVGARNILDSRQRDFDTGAARDAGYIYGPAQPRTVFAGVRGTL